MEVKLIPNFLEKKKFELAEWKYRRISCEEVFKECYPDRELEDFVPVVSGRVGKWDELPSKDDQIVFVQNLEGGGGGIFSAVLGAVMVVVGAVLCWTGVGAGLGAYMIAAGVGMMLSGAAAMLFSPTSPTTPTSVNDMSNSQTYSWGGVKNIIGEGSPIPIVYGTHRVGGVIIEAFIRGSSGWGKQKNKILSVLVALSEGAIKGVRSETVQIAEKEIAYYNDGYTVETQITPLHDVYLPVDSEILLPLFSNVKKFSLTVGGDLLYLGIGDGRPDSANSIQFEVSYQKVGEVEWETISAAASNSKKGEYSSRFDIPLPSVGDYQIKVKRLSPENRYSSKVYAKSAECIQHLYEIDYDVRFGENTQSAIAEFNQIAKHYSLSGVKLTRPKNGQSHSYYHYKTKGKINEGKFSISFPNLFSTDDSGSIKNLTVAIQCCYAPIGTEDYSTPQTHNISNSSKSKCEYDIVIKFPKKGQYIVRFERLTRDFAGIKENGDSYLSGVTEYEALSLTYPNTALMGCRFVATDKLSGSMPSLTAVIDGKKVINVIDIVENDDGTFELPSPKWSDNPADILFDIITNTRYGLGRKLTVENIHLPSFQEWARFCDEVIKFKEFDIELGVEQEKQEKRFSFGFVVDKTYKAPELITKICNTCRAIPMWEGDKFKVGIDRASEPVQLFTMDNIVEDSFEENYLGLKDIPNQFEAEILDETNDYKRSTIVAVDKDRLGEQLEPRKINLFGLTTKSRATRELMFKMRRARAMKRIVAFQAGFDAVVCECGDVVVLQYGYPDFGISGTSIKSIDRSPSGAKIHLERPVPLVNGERCKLRIRLNDNTFWINEFIAQVPEGETETFTLTPSEIPPATVLLGQLVLVGAYKYDETLYRIISIEKGSADGKIKINAEEYNESIYEKQDEDGFWIDDGSISIKAKNYGKLGRMERYELDGSADDPDPIKLADNDVTPVPPQYAIPPYIKNIELQERNIIEEDKVVTSIWIDWEDLKMDEPLLTIDRYKVLHSFDGEDWSVVSSVRGSQYEMRNVERGKRHYFAIKPYTNFGVTNNIEDSPQSKVYSIVPQGEVPVPDQVIGFLGHQSDKMIQFRWDEVTNTPIRGYEIRQGRWELGKRIAFTANAKVAVFVGDYGDVDFYIKPMNINGVYSRIATKVSVHVYDSGERNLIFTHDDMETGWQGVMTGGAYKDPAGRLRMNPDETVGTYISGYIDLQSPAKSVNYVQYSLEAIIGNTNTWELSKYSWLDPEANAVWYDLVDTRDIRIDHEISFFSGLSDEYVDVFRLIDHTNSVNGLPATTAENIEHAQGTFHKGVQQTLQNRLEYSVNFPAKFSFFFRLRLSELITPGFVAKLNGEAPVSIVMAHKGVFWITVGGTQLEIKCPLDGGDNLIFGISYDGGNLLAFVGNITTKQHGYASAPVEALQVTGFQFHPED